MERRKNLEQLVFFRDWWFFVTPFPCLVGNSASWNNFFPSLQNWSILAAKAPENAWKEPEV